MEMQRKLYEAVVTGNVSTLNALIQQDPLILDRINANSVPDFFNSESPLHIAALLGHSDVARSLLSHRPELATELDALGRAPLHLASAKGRVSVVRELLRVDPSVCVLRSKDGKAPLHLAVMKGRIEAVRELVKASPESTRLSSDCGGNVLHLCVRYNCLDALRVLAETVHDENYYNSEDEVGNTIFHLAVLLQRLEIIKYLISEVGIAANTLNKNGVTALDLIENSPQDLKTLEIRTFLIQSGAKRARDLNSPSATSIRQQNTPQSKPPRESWKAIVVSHDSHGLARLEGVLLIAAAVAAATSFQAGVNVPPGDSDLAALWTYITVSLVSSLSVILLLVSGCSLKNKTCACVVSLLGFITLAFIPLAYLESVAIAERRRAWIRSTPDGETRYLIVVWLVLLSGAAVFHAIRLALAATRPRRAR